MSEDVIVVGLTGMPGSGKSVFAKALSGMHAIHINADELGHEVLYQEKVKNDLLDEFGEDILNDGEIDRKMLADVAFKKSKIKKLNEICHPVIQRKVEEIIAHKPALGCYYVLEAALLIEASFEKLASFTVHINSSFDVRLSRVREQRSWSQEELMRRDSLQNEELKEKKSDIIIENTKDLDTFLKKVLELDIVTRYNACKNLNGADYKKSVLAMLRENFPGNFKINKPHHK